MHQRRRFLLLRRRAAPPSQLRQMQSAKQPLRGVHAGSHRLLHLRVPIGCLDSVQMPQFAQEQRAFGLELYGRIVALVVRFRLEKAEMIASSII